MGDVTLTLEGIAPQNRTRQRVTQVIEEDFDKKPFWTDTSPSASVRLISFGQGDVFSGPHEERVVVHRLTKSVQENIAALGDDELTQPLVDLATELAEMGRPWEALDLVGTNSQMVTAMVNADGKIDELRTNLQTANGKIAKLEADLGTKQERINRLESLWRNPWVNRFLGAVVLAGGSVIVVLLAVAVNKFKEKQDSSSGTELV